MYIIMYCEFSENKCAKILKFTGSQINTVNKKKIFFQKKKSGLKGLKNNAVPTIFFLQMKKFPTRVYWEIRQLKSIGK